MTLFRLASPYLASKTLRILRVELIVPSELRHSSTYALIKDYYGLTLLSVKGLKSYAMTPTICPDHPLNGPSPPNMMSSENLDPILKR